MSESHEHQSPSSQMSDAELAWIEQNLDRLRREVSGQRILHSRLVIAFVFGLAAHVCGWWFARGAPDELTALLSSLLIAFGLALWTGVVIAVFVELLPAAQQRAANRLLNEYEAAIRDRKRGLRRT